ncbi:hypothetical protein DFQ04_1853 [Algoriphagus boseongensis]|uniref:Uncharacterized protein n=1 Tax=Algoriphagus boseongensis TaxID=1442587 RepID=A0A4R6T414_9BACT|nr:hypothetical protein [Algoriphagus boseongensis]TDQ17201.1 hypothetical protein DFQ04_1853 [Algoriphagus boseongensis]
MQELIIYAFLFLALLGHCLLAGTMYRKVHADEELSLTEKNFWKLRALIFPLLFWFYYHQEKKRRSS